MKWNLEGRLRLRLCLRETDWAGALFPLATLLQKLYPLITLENATLGSDTAGFFEAGVL